jgi:uncharacterized protein
MHAASPLSPAPPLSPSAVRPWYAHRWPWFLMLGPFLVVVAGSLTIYLAYTRQDAMVVADYYAQGKAINQDLRRDRAATALGLVFEAHYDPAGGRLYGTLAGAGGPVGKAIRLHLAHSTQAQKDIELAAALDERGAFSVALPMLEQARWEVVVEGERRDWRLAGGWQWPRRQSLRIAADAPPAD